MKIERKTADQIKEEVREKYTQISRQSKPQNESSCCGAGCGCNTTDEALFADDYSAVEGYKEEADLGLGCGLPTEFARISKGDTVLDLGSGAGNDCFVARQVAGEEGRVIGLDMTGAMNAKARRNAADLGYRNMAFILGDIEAVPLGKNTVDVVISNCVLNLVPDKQKAFSEIHRILRPGGHFSISDVVLSGDLPEKIREDSEMYAGCVSGAINREAYLNLVRKAGFESLKIQKEKRIVLPEEILSKYLSQEEIQDFRSSRTGIYSISLYAEKRTSSDVNQGEKGS